MAISGIAIHGHDLVGYAENTLVGFQIDDSMPERIWRFLTGTSLSQIPCTPRNRREIK